MTQSASTYVDTTELPDASLFGYAVAAGDVDGDGEQEAIATAPGKDPGMIKVWK